jgi:F-type H+-transporting ATPase subunit delta
VRQGAAPYAKALFAIARERDQTELVGRELDEVTATVGNIAELRGFLARPWIPAEVKRKAAMEVARSAGLSRLSCDFLGLVAANGRTDHLPVIAVHYRKLQDDELHRARARVRSAVALSAAARGALVAKLERRFEGRHVVLEEVVDPTMLGGFIVEIGGVVLDASLEGQLDTIRRRLGRGDTDPGRQT